MKIIITLFGLIFFSLVSQAQVFVKADASGIQDGSSWQNAFTNLQDALNAAAPGAQIWVAEGTYIPSGPTPDSSHFITKKAVELYGGFSGTETVLDERDWTTHVTIISGDKNKDDIEGSFNSKRTDNAHHVLILDARASKSVIDGFLFKGGMTRTDALAADSRDTLYNRWRGGALYVRRTGVDILNCTFRDNYGYQGTGLFVGGDTSKLRKLTIQNIKVENNVTINGGACWLAGYAEAIMMDSHFTSDSSGSLGGGLVTGNMNLKVIDCFFEENRSDQGAAIFIFQNATTLFPHLVYDFTRCHFTQNQASNSGGAIRYNNFVKGFDITFDSCTFHQNVVTGDFGGGGGIFIQDSPDTETGEPLTKVIIRNTEFTGNIADYCGAVELDTYDDIMDIEISNCQFLQNRSPKNGGGGALYLFANGNGIFHANIEHSAFDGNESTVYGGGLVCESNNNINQSSYNILDCSFTNNLANFYGGALVSLSSQVKTGLTGTITNSLFTGNRGVGLAGALYSQFEVLTIDRSTFSNNSTDSILNPLYNGGGATFFYGPAVVKMRNTIFDHNTSDVDGSAIYLKSNVDGDFSNLLIHSNEGTSTIYTEGRTNWINNTIVDNTGGVKLASHSNTQFQNSIFNNTPENAIIEDSLQFNSRGGNISSDLSMLSILTGYGAYDDINETDPFLGPDFAPLSGSPAIDIGNSEGVILTVDLAGNDRINGSGIDAGSYESFTVATQDVLWEDPDFKVFPNPVRTNVNWTITEPVQGNLSATIYNLMGQPVLHTKHIDVDGDQSYSIPVGGLPAGEYYLLVTSGLKKYGSTIMILSQ